VHMKFGFRRRLVAREVNLRLGLLMGVMRSWVASWIRILEAGERGKLHGHYITRLHPNAVDWGIDYTMEIIRLNRAGCGLGRCSAEWVRDAEGAARYLSETWRSGESHLVGGRAFQCAPGVRRFRDLWRNAEWLAGVEQFLLLHGCQDKEEILCKLGPMWAYCNAYTIGRLGRAAVAEAAKRSAADAAQQAKLAHGVRPFVQSAAFAAALGRLGADLDLVELAKMKIVL